MKKIFLYSIILGFAISGCNSGSTSSGVEVANKYGPYTTNGDPEINLNIIEVSGDSIKCSETTCTITGDATLGLGLSFSSVTPQAYFTLSPPSASGIVITSSGTNCDSNPSTSPQCTYTYKCIGNGTGKFYYQLNGIAGVANIDEIPITINCFVNELKE